MNIIQGPPLSSSIPKMTVGQFYFEKCEEFSERICQIDATTDEKETFGSVKTRSVRVALELQKRGVTSTDVIAFCSKNTIDTIVPILATYYLGAKVANLEPSLSVKLAEHLVSLVEPKIIFVEDSSVAFIEEVGNNLKHKFEVLKYSEVVHLEFAEEEKNFEPVKVDVHNPALFLFTSGTSGLPKAIYHTHRSILHSYECFDFGVRGEHLNLFQLARFYWVTAHAILNSSFTHGTYRVFLQEVSVEGIFKAFEKYKVQAGMISTSLIPAILNFEKAPSYDLSALKYLAVAGSPLSAAFLNQTKKIFKDSLVLFCFGMSEGAVLKFDPIADREHIAQKIGSCGRPTPGLSVKIADVETDEALGPNQKGELRFKGPMLFQGYYKMDSSAAFDKDGFVKTGDIAYYDEDRCIYVVERIKEMFKFKGWHIVPSFLEGILLEHPAVKEAAIFGKPENESNAPCACVVLNDNYKITETELQAFFASKVCEREQLIGGITFAKSLPKTPTGKILRREIRDKILNGDGL